jgi:methyl-accepting chemotaxis protein
MKYFTDLSTRAKLIFSFGLVWVMFLIVIIIAYRGIVGIAQSEKVLNDVYSTINNGLSDLRGYQNFNRAAFLDMMLTQKQSEHLIIEKGIDENAQLINDIIEKLIKLNPDPGFLSKMKEIKETVAAYRQGRKEEIALIKEGKIEQAKQLAAGISSERFEKIRSTSTELEDKAVKDSDEQIVLDQKEANSSIFLFLLLGIVAFIFSIIIVIVMNRTIAYPLTVITKTASQIASGDLEVEVIAVKRKDEIGILLQTFAKMINVLKIMAAAAQQIASGDLKVTIVPQSKEDILGNNFLQMVNNLRRIIKDTSEGVNLIASSSSEILAATTQVASGSAETATAIAETTATVEEVRQAAQLSSQKASRVSENAQQVSQVTMNGQIAVDETINGMHDIQNQMEAVANTIVRLSEQSQQIGGIIASVTDVADQSNLLAVNAAIEAAKAGEQGKGFAVVAQEIKSLAQQSKQATIQVRNILTDFQKATSAAVMATEQTSKAVENGVKQSTLAGDAIKKLAESSGKALEAASQIVASSQQQAVGMDQIGLAMQNINQAGNENASSMVQAEKAAKGLNELGQKLKLLVEQYKL